MNLVFPCHRRDVEHGGELAPLFPGDFRVVEQPALFSVLFDLVEVVVECVPEAVVRGEVAVAALVGLLVEPRVVGQDAVDGGIPEHGEVKAVVVDACADGFLRLVGVFGIGVLEREFALVLETGVDGVCE